MKYLLFIVLLFVISAEVTKAKHSKVKGHKSHVREAKNFKVKGPNNHVNLSLETAFVFDPKEAYSDVVLLRTLRSFLDSLQAAINTKTRLRSKPKSQYGLPDFLYEIGVYIINYKDENIKSFAIALQSNVEDYYPAGTAYHKILYDPRLKAFVKNSLKEWAETDPTVLRKNMKALYDGPTYDEVFTNFAEAINIFFSDEDSDTLVKLASRFKDFPTTQKKLNSNIERALNFVVFDRYKMLNFTDRALLLQELSKVSDYVGKNFRDKSLDPEAFMFKRASDNVSLFGEFIQGDKKMIHVYPPSNEFSGSEREEFPRNPDDSLEKITKASEETKSPSQPAKELDIHEIVLNKALQINVLKSENPSENLSKERSTSWNPIEGNFVSSKANVQAKKEDDNLITLRKESFWKTNE